MQEIEVSNVAGQGLSEVGGSGHSRDGHLIKKLIVKNNSAEGSIQTKEFTPSQGVDLEHQQRSAHQ